MGVRIPLPDRGIRAGGTAARMLSSCHVGGPLQCHLEHTVSGPEVGVVDDVRGVGRLSVHALFVIDAARAGNQCSDEVSVGAVNECLPYSIVPQPDPACLI